MNHHYSVAQFHFCALLILEMYPKADLVALSSVVVLVD